MLLVGTNVQAEDKKVDPTGTWTWTVPGRDGGEPRTSTLKLKKEGDKLTGTMSMRQNEVAIEEGTIKGDEVSFKVTRQFREQKFTSKYTGKVSGDTIKGKMEFTGRDGETRSRDWEVKRAAQGSDTKKSAS